MKLSRFKSAAKVAPFLYMSERKLRDLCSTSNVVHGIIMMDGTLLIHPDPLFKEIGKAGQRFLKRLCAGKQSLPQMSKTLRLR